MCSRGARALSPRTGQGSSEGASQAAQVKVRSAPSLLPPAQPARWHARSAQESLYPSHPQFHGQRTEMAALFQSCGTSRSNIHRPARTPAPLQPPLPSACEEHGKISWVAKSLALRQVLQPYDKHHQESQLTASLCFATESSSGNPACCCRLLSHGNDFWGKKIKITHCFGNIKVLLFIKTF